MENEICEYCDGEGAVEYSQDRWVHGIGHTTRDWVEACPCCKGSGIAPAPREKSVEEEEEDRPLFDYGDNSFFSEDEIPF